MPDHLCANSVTGGVEYWLVRRYTSRDVNIQSHFEESSTLFLKIILISLTTRQIIPNGLLMVGSTDPLPVYDFTRSCSISINFYSSSRAYIAPIRKIDARGLPPPCRPEHSVCCCYHTWLSLRVNNFLIFNDSFTKLCILKVWQLYI